MTSIFLSYARKDDEPFVEQLYENLTENGFEVWWDRKRMSSRGQSFLRELRLAIASHERLILVVGPKALKSEVVSAELGNALRDCKIVIPILRIGEPERLAQDLPEKIRTLHCLDFRESRPLDEALAELHRILREQARPLGQSYGVPALPSHYLPRAEEIESLLKSVLADDYEPIVITSAKQTVALQGMGGVGKSVLAAALAQTCEVRRAFSDGLIWLAFGQQAEAIDNLRRVGRTLNDGEQHYLDLARAEARLSEVLENKDCLLILDDIWNLKQTEAFRSALANTRCRLLITTRDGGVVNALGAEPHRVDILTDEQALRLLADWSGQPVGNLPPEASEVADECGNLPFALALCGAMVRAGNLWADLRDKLRAADLTFIEQQLPDYPYKDVLRSLRVSADALDQEDRERDKPLHAKQHYLELSVFPPDTAVPEAAVATLWQHANGLDDASARKLISILESKALLRAEGEAASRRISLHDLQHDYMRAVLGDLKPQHQQLLEAYRRKSPDGWPSGPHDGYFYGHLVYHLLEAGRAAELHELLTGETAEGRNAWYEAKESKSDLASYMADVRRAWRQAEDEYPRLEDEARRLNVGQQIGYALIVSSVNSLAQNVPAHLLASLVKADVWSASRVMAYARQVPDDEQRADTMIQLFPYVGEKERENWFLETMTTIRKLHDERARGERLRSLVETLREPKPEQMIRAVLTEIKAFTHGDRQAHWLAELAPFLSPDQALYAVEIAEGSYLNVPSGDDFSSAATRVRTKRAKTRALMELARRLPETKCKELMEKTVWDAELYGYTPIIALALSLVGKEHWSDTYERALRRTLESAHLDKDRLSRATSLPVLLPLLPPEEQEAMLEEPLAIIANFGGDRHWKTESISTLFTSATEPLREKILGFIEQLRNEYDRIAIKAKIAPLLSQEKREAMLGEVLKEVRQSNDGFWASELLQEIAPHLSPRLKGEALELVFNIETEEHYRVKALAALMPAFSADEPEREDALRRAGDWVRDIGDPYQIKEALEALAPHLSPTLLKEALARAQAIGDTDRQIYGLDVLVPLLPEDVREDAFRFILKRVVGWEGWVLAQALTEMTKDLPPSLVKDALAIARGIREPLYRARALAGFAASLPTDERKQVLDEAKATADPIPEAQHHAEVLAMIAEAAEPDMREPLVREGLALVEQVADANLYANVLTRFLPFLEEAERDKILETAYERVRYSKYSHKALAYLAPHLPEELTRKAFEFAQYYFDAYDMGDALPAIGLRLAEFGEYEKVYAAFMELEAKQVDALTALAHRLPRHMLEQAVKDAWQIDPNQREGLLSALAIRLAELDDHDGALKIARQLAEPLPQAKAFTGIAPYLGGAGCNEVLPAALEATLRIEHPGELGRCLRELAPILAGCDKAGLYAMLHSALTSLSAKVRFHAIPQLYMLSPVVAALAGTETVREIWRAVRDVYHWWP